MAFNYKRQGIGNTTAIFPQVKTEESALGNLMADAILAAGKKQGGAQFALINAGGIRSNLPAGRITYDNIFKLMPFDNYLVVAELKGAELRALLQVAMSGALGMPSVSGFQQITRLDVPTTSSGPWDRDLNNDGTKEEWERNLLMDVRDQNGKPIDDGKMYKVATITFLAEGGDYQDIIYEHIPADRIHVYGVTLIRDVFANYFKSKSPLNPSQYYSKAKPRIKLVGPPAPTAASPSQAKQSATQ
jgi:2',3'-cyclic-nucleotide 2'-phosphodiesterase (5'-nucleotidase family)